MAVTYDPMPIVEAAMVIAMPLMFALGCLIGVCLIGLLSK